MTKSDFDALLGPVIEIVDDKIRQYRRQQEKYDKEKLLPETIPTKHNIKYSQSNNNNNIINKRDKICELNELKTIGILGKGAFGLVSLVIDTKTNKSYALKAIKKHQIVELGQQVHIISEKRVMEKMYSKFTLYI